MSGRRKHPKGRHHGGGRPTSRPTWRRGLLPSPASPVVESQLASGPDDEVADAATALLDEFVEAAHDGLAIDIDVWASELVGAAGMAVSPDVPWDTDAELVAAVGGRAPTLDELLFSVVGTVGEALLGPRRVTAMHALWAMLAYLDDEPAEMATDFLATTALPGPDWVRDVGHAVVDAALRHDHETEDSKQIGLVARYPDSGKRFIVLVHIDTTLGGLPVDVAVTDQIDVVDEMAELEGIVTTPIDLPTARAEIADSYRLEDMTVGPALEPAVELMRPMLDRLLETMPAPADLPDPPETPLSERDAVVAELVHDALPGARVVGFDSAELSVAARLMVDYCCDWHGRHPTSWSPRRLEMFLMDHVPRKLAMVQEDLEDLPEALATLVPAAHRLAGWEERNLDDALRVLSDAAGPFRSALHEAEHGSSSTDMWVRAVEQGLDLDDADAVAAFIDRVAAAGGLDASLDGPGPAAALDVSGLDDSLRDRVRAIDDTTLDICVELFDREHFELSRRVLLRLAAERPLDLQRGRIASWAGGIVYALAQINGVWAGGSDLRVHAADVAETSGVSRPSLAQRAKRIRDWFDLDADPTPEVYLRSDRRQRRSK